MIAILLISFAVLAVFGLPLALGLGLSALLAIVLASPFPVVIVAQKMVGGINSYILLAIPLFMLTGRLMNTGGITDRILEFARSLLGRVKGGLAHANVLASIIFAGMSGSAVADAAGLGMVEIDAMKKQGYTPEFSAAVTVASSAIGPIIPPSIPMVIYAAIAEVSIGRLFLAGFLPGILMGVALMIMIYFMSFRINFPIEPRVSIRQVFHTFRKAFLALLTPVILIGGIIGGVFTPTEAGAVAVVYSFLITFFVYKTITIRDIPRILVDTMVTTSVVTLLISASSALSWMFSINRVAFHLTNFILTITRSRVAILIVLNLLMLVLGALMEAGVLIVLLTPVFLPLAISIGLDPVHFGVILVLNLMIGVVTPPVGVCLFVVSSANQIKLERLMKSVVVFVIPLVVVLFVSTFWPRMVLLIPRALMK